MLFIVSADSIREGGRPPSAESFSSSLSSLIKILKSRIGSVIIRPLKRKRAVPHTSILSIYLFLPPKYTMDRRYIYTRPTISKIGYNISRLIKQSYDRSNCSSFSKEKDKKPRIKLNRSIRLLDVLNFNGKRRREKKEEKIPYERRAL